MKTLRSISTAVLFFLILAAPAAADSTINLTVSPTESVVGTPVTYTVSGEAEVTQMYEVRIMQVDSSHPETECVRATKNSQLLRQLEVQGKGSPLKPFRYPESGEETIPVKDYSELGTYTVCAILREGRTNCNLNECHAESTTNFTVVAVTKAEEAAKTAEAQKKEAQEKKAKENTNGSGTTPTITPSLTPPPPVAPVIKPVVKPVSKLAKALKLCKKQKNKHKRAKCEKLAKRKYGSKIRR
jgi:hypothetical protein